MTTAHDDRFEIPHGWLRITTLDVHTAGEPLRIITGGYPPLEGDTIVARRRFAREHHDDLRRALMWEPRGHADMYGCLLVPPATVDGDVGVLFLHNEGYSTMCGHGIIGLVKAGLEAGLLPADVDPGAIRIDTPAGRVVARARLKDGRVEGVSFTNVASFVLHRDLEVEVEDLGHVHCDVAFGGAFYAYVDAASVGLQLEPRRYADIVTLGRRIKHAVQAAVPVRHPEGDPDLGFLYGTIFVDRSAPGVHSRNACVFADGEVDRSPTGTGVSGRAAIHHARGELGLGDAIEIESLVGSRFTVRVTATTSVGGRPAVVPEVSGTAHVTGRHEFLIDPADPLRQGFLLR